MGTSNFGHNLLFGLLGLQTGLVSQADLVAAVGVWLADKSLSLEEILVTRGALGENERQLLQALLKTHLTRHGGDVSQSIAALSSIDSAIRELNQLQDGDVDATLSMASYTKPTFSDTRTIESPHGRPITLETTADASSSSTSRFTIIRRHARGGLGEVSVARDLELNREVALKEIQTQYADDQNSRARFLLEAEITGGLEHPGIVPVYGLGQYADGRPYYAMRFIRGDSLQEAAERFHRPHSDNQPASNQPPIQSEPKPYESVEFRKLLGRFVDVCNAIAYANAHGILHRDLKPGNIMLGKYGETLVVDWGLAKSIGRTGDVPNHGENTLLPSSGSSTAPTQLGSAVGTPAYMPPEQAEGKLDELGPASDVYSLGATLHFMLTGQAPVKGSSVAEVLTKVQRGDIQAADAVKPGVPKPLAAICSRAMAKAPQDRYPNSSELADEIERYLADEPIRAHADSLGIRARRWMRKHPRLVTSLAATLLAGLCSTITIAWIVTTKNNQLNEANAQERSARMQADIAKAQAENAAAQEMESRELAEMRRQQAEAAMMAAAQAQAAAEKALEQEMLAKDEAESRRQQAETVLNFVSDRVLTTARPLDQDGGLGINVTVREALAAAESRIAEDFVDQPLAEAIVRRTIGTTFFMLGDYTKAVGQHLQAVELSRTKLGVTSDTTLFCMNELAMAHKYAGNIDESFQTYEEMLQAIEQMNGADAIDTLTYKNNLGEAYRAAGRISQALPMLEDTLRRRKEVLGPNHPHTLTTMNNLALAVEDAGDRIKAIPLFEQTLELRRAELTDKHPHTLQSMNNLAAAYRANGEFDKAIVLHREALASLTEQLTEKHPETLNAMNNLGMALLANGKTDDAIKILQTAFAGRSETLQANHPATFQSMTNLAEAMFLGEQSEQAEGIIEQYLSARRTQEDVPPSRLAEYLYTAASLLYKYQQYEAAEKRLAQFQDISGEEGVEAWLKPAAQGLRGLILEAQQKFAEAEPLLLKSFSDLEQWRVELPTKTGPIMQRIAQSLVELYTNKQQEQKADEWRDVLAEFLPTSP